MRLSFLIFIEIAKLVLQSPDREIKYEQNVNFSSREIKYMQNLIPLRYYQTT